jgi:hypothetical protein
LSELRQYTRLEFGSYAELVDNDLESFIRLGRGRATKPMIIGQFQILWRHR